MSEDKGYNANKGCLQVLLFIGVLGVLVWVYGETDKAGDIAGGIMKIIMAVAGIAIYILYEKEKKGK
jgi:cbb3-type cytochrome oxidase subunit 3